MYQSKGLVSAAALFIATASVVDAGAAAADAPATGGATSVPLISIFRTCDFVNTRWVSATGTGSGSALIGTSGSNQVSAQVNLATAQPNTRYTVRLIQVPRASERTCTAGDPGVAVGELFTDGNGTGPPRSRDLSFRERRVPGFPSTDRQSPAESSVSSTPQRSSPPWHRCDRIRWN